jgi:hypothetical protein
VVKVGVSSVLKEKGRKRTTFFTGEGKDPSIRHDGNRKAASELLYTSSGEDHFQRDKRKRIEQLDEWLKNGLIDRKEYDELKRRYREEFK